jgi:excisionase family DNA binding protein
VSTADELLDVPDVRTPWLDYREAAAYTRLAVGTLQCLVSARQIPVYGSRRCRRFRREMLDLWLRDRKLAMRKWEEELKRTW